MNKKSVCGVRNWEYLCNKFNGQKWGEGLGPIKISW